MLQIVLLFYLFAVISGAAAFSRLFSDYRLTRDRITLLYIRYFITYTTMVLGVGFLSYVRVNISSRFDLERLSVSLILITSGLLARSNAIWVFSSRRLIVPRGLNTLMLVNVIVGILSGAGIRIFSAPLAAVLAVGITMTLFAVTVVLTIVLSSRQDRLKGAVTDAVKAGRNARIFAGISIVLLVLEVVFLREFTINLGWFCSLPLIYTGWNILSMISSFQPGLIPDSDHFSRAAARFALTPKETEVVRCVLRGLTNHEISYELGITRSTIKNHITNIYRKTGVSGRVNLVNLIRSETLWDPPGPPGGSAYRI